MQSNISQHGNTPSGCPGGDQLDSSARQFQFYQAPYQKTYRTPRASFTLFPDTINEPLAPPGSLAIPVAPPLPRCLGGTDNFTFMKRGVWYYTHHPHVRAIWPEVEDEKKDDRTNADSIPSTNGSSDNDTMAKSFPPGPFSQHLAWCLSNSYRKPNITDTQKPGLHGALNRNLENGMAGEETPVDTSAVQARSKYHFHHDVTAPMEQRFACVWGAQVGLRLPRLGLREFQLPVIMEEVSETVTEEVSETVAEEAAEPVTEEEAQEEAGGSGETSMFKLTKSSAFDFSFPR